MICLDCTNTKLLVKDEACLVSTLLHYWKFGPKWHSTHAATNKLAVHNINIRQGNADAIYIKAPTEENSLIDTGNKSDAYHIKRVVAAVIILSSQLLSPPV